MELVPDLNLFNIDAVLLRDSSQTANKKINTLNTLSMTFTRKRTIPRSVIPPCMNLCIIPL